LLVVETFGGLVLFGSVSRARSIWASLDCSAASFCAMSASKPAIVARCFSISRCAWLWLCSTTAPGCPDCCAAVSP
jgi:hypothetical protein